MCVPSVMLQSACPVIKIQHSRDYYKEKSEISSLRSKDKIVLLAWGPDVTHELRPQRRLILFLTMPTLLDFWIQWITSALQAHDLSCWAWSCSVKIRILGRNSSNRDLKQHLSHPPNEARLGWMRIGYLKSLLKQYCIEKQESFLYGLVYCGS